jgi:hypothetical protein
MGSHDSTHCTTWRAIHRAHQAAAMEMVTGVIMRRTARLACVPLAIRGEIPNRHQA